MDHEKKDLKTLQKEINSLRADLKRINEDKETWFKKKEDLKKEIADLITKVKTQKKTSDASSEEAKKFLKERDNYNKKVRKLINRINAVQNEKKKLLEKYKIKHDPDVLKKNIDQLEEKIETEALSIDAEKRLVEKIKRLKKYYEELGGVKLISDKVTQLSKEIEDSKEKANEAHKKFKKVIKEKKSGYGEFFTLSKQINIIKKQQEKAFEMFISLKNNFISVSRQLHDKVNILRKTDQEKKTKQKLKEAKKKRTEERIIEEKTKKAEEKLKAGKKLTTEDLLAMQGKKDEDLNSEELKEN